MTAASTVVFSGSENSRSGATPGDTWIEDVDGVTTLHVVLDDDHAEQLEDLVFRVGNFLRSIDDEQPAYAAGLAIVLACRQDLDERRAVVADARLARLRRIIKTARSAAAEAGRP